MFILQSKKSDQIPDQNVLRLPEVSKSIVKEGWRICDYLIQYFFNTFLVYLTDILISVRSPPDRLHLFTASLFFPTRFTVTFSFLSTQVDQNRVKSIGQKTKIKLESNFICWKVYYKVEPNRDSFRGDMNKQV